MDQYYPLLFTSYWVEYRLWGADAKGYHVTNLVLHLVNIVLVVLLLQQLGTPPWAAMAAAAVFALHPTQVASVVWVAEQKNTLSGCFYLIAFLLYLHHRRTGSWAAYAGCLTAFLAALLSKTQTVTLPVSLLLAEWLLQAKARLRELGVREIGMRLAPMVAIGLLALVVTTVVEQHKVDVGWFRLPSATERAFIVANAPWFYAAKFLLPINLAPIYPRWSISAVDPVWWVGIIAWPVVIGALARWRQRIGTFALWGIAHFWIALTPVLGFISYGYQQHTFVADHYLYLANIGGGLALAVLVDRLAGHAQWTNRRIAATAVGTILIALYAVQSLREAHHWHNTPTFWRRVIERNPSSFAAYYSLAEYSRNSRNWAEALPLYRRAAEIRTDSPGAFNGYADALRKTQGDAAAIAACTAKLEQDPSFLAGYLQRARSYEALSKREEALTDYGRVLSLAPAGSEAWKVAEQRRNRLQSGASN